MLPQPGIRAGLTEDASTDVMETEKLRASARRYVEKGQLKKAVGDYERLVAANGSDVRTRLELADMYMRTDAPKKAIGEWLACNDIYKRDGSGVKSIGVLLQVVRADPNHLAGHQLLGKVYADHGLLDDSARHFGEALRCATSSPNNDVARFEVVEAILSLDEDNLADRLRLAEAYSGIGQVNDAGRMFRTVAEVVAKKDGAEDDYRVVVERLLYHQPNEGAAARKLGDYYLKKGEPQRALAKLRHAYKAAPEDLQVLGLLAETFNRLGQSHKSVTVLKVMAEHYQSAGLSDEVRDCYERVLALEPNDQLSRDKLGLTKTDDAGQLIEFDPEALDEPAPAPRPEFKPAPKPTELVQAAHSDADDDDDFDFDFDDEEEIGFGETAENTIVDDAFIPDDVRQHLANKSGITLAIPGAADPETAAAQTASNALQEDLRELDFYIENGLADEARALVNELKQRHGEHPALGRRERSVEGLAS